MIRASHVVVPMGLVVLSAATVVLAGPLAAPGGAAGSAAPSASATASTSSPRPSRPSPPVVLAKGDIPETESAPPKLSEWGTGRVVRMDVNTRADCKATIVREWVQIDCQNDDWDIRPGGGIRQLAGDPKGVGVFVSSNERSGGGKDANIVMPLRRGDHRVFQFFDLHMAVYGSSIAPSSILEERWLEGEDRPTLVLR